MERPAPREIEPAAVAAVPEPAPAPTPTPRPVKPATPKAPYVPKSAAKAMAAPAPAPESGPEGESAAVEAPIEVPGAKPAGRVRLWIGAGIENGATPENLRELILGSTGEPDASLGRVDVRERHAFAEVPGDRAASFVSRLKRTEFAGKRIKVKIA
jgi:hypothetical protein